jgi:uncharacterized RDD family membrane protein YckC
MTTMPPDPQDPTGQAPPPPPPPGYGAPAYNPMGAGIPAPPGQWAGPPLAEWPQRFVAALIDGLIVGIPYNILLRISMPIGLLYYVGSVVYLMYMQGTTGQTVGKKVMNIKLLREADGQVVGVGLSIARYFVHIVDVIPCLIGYLWPLWDAKKQTFADKILSTVVVKS